MSVEYYTFLSIVVVGIIIALIKIIERVKFQDLVGSQKATNVIIALIVVGEAVYLSISFSLLRNAIETVTSLSALLIFFAFVYLNKLQNAASGLSIALSSRINVGDKVEVDGKKGTIVQIGLTKTVVQADESKDTLVFIPNKKFDEEVSVLKYTSKKKTSIPSKER